MTDFKPLETNYDIEWEVERSHWWFSVRRKILASLLSSMNLAPNSIVMDIGCGTGSNLLVLKEKRGHSIGLDGSFYALSLAQKVTDLPLLNGDLNKLPVKPNSIDLIVAMDVLEHVDNDVDGINEFYRVLKKGGKLILTVPAFSFLWGIQDKVTGHKRRYLMTDIADKLRDGGFNMIRSSYFNFFLFFPILLMRRIIGFLGLKIESENKINHPLINFFLKAIFSLESYLLKYISFPFGVSIFCMAKKGN